METIWKYFKMMKDKFIDGKKIISRLKGKFSKLIKDSSSRFDDYLTSPKIRHILLHWGYELTKKDFLINSTN